MGKIRVLLVDDHPVVLEGLQSVMSAAPEIESVTCCSSGAGALTELRRNPYDVMLVDMRMAPMGGLETLRAAKKLFPELVVLVLSSYDLDEEVFQALRGGAAGYLNKTSSSRTIVQDVVRAVQGTLQISPALLDRMRERQQRPELTPREHEVLEMVARDLTNKDIARVLGVSPFTVRNRVSNVLTKLDATDRTEMIRVAIELGILVL